MSRLAALACVAFVGIAVPEAMAGIGTVYGEVWFNNKRTSGAEVIVVDVKTTKVIARTVSKKQGKWEGQYEIIVPAQKSLAVMAKQHGFTSVAHRITRWSLKPGKRIKINLTIELKDPRPER